MWVLFVCSKFFFSVDLLACEVVGCTNVVNFTDDNEDVFKD